MHLCESEISRGLGRKYRLEDCCRKHKVNVLNLC